MPATKTCDPVSRDYIHRCRLRVNRYIASRGDFLLDAGSGPVQWPEYLTYSEDYRFRVCLDISITALKEARSGSARRVCTLSRILPTSRSNLTRSMVLSRCTQFIICRCVIIAVRILSCIAFSDQIELRQLSMDGIILA